jgi:crossover junction endodeoxyribonuclease RusA
MYKFTLPFPPSNNTYYRHVDDRVLLSKKGRDYKQAVVEILQRLGLAKIMIEDAVLIRLELYRGDRRSYDADNFNKAVYDSLSHGGFWVDDELVIESQARKMNYKQVNPNGRVEVFVEFDMQAGFC